ncbi:CYP2J2: Cytochrome protein [Crotalus adamanteus]|uniref:CYP2J2: Cytochrome protein n=1 Tax=Crotalus adamanteus TaxID=8729 RepID=A0AAW1BGM4_CROAD
MTSPSGPKNMLGKEKEKVELPIKRYGNIYTMWVGPQLQVVLSGFKTVKEVMTSFPEELSDRSEDAFITAVGKKKGKCK